MKLCGYAVLLLSVTMLSYTCAAWGEVVSLECEGQKTPLGIDATSPRFSWKLTAPSETRGVYQTAYRILAATSVEVLEKNKGDLWDSGRVESAQQTQIPYAGIALQSGQRVYWKVEVWCTPGDLVWQSEVSWFEMGLLSPVDWHAKWISGPTRPIKDGVDLFKEHPAPLLRKTFTLPKHVQRARMYVTGLGYYELFLNGEPVSAQKLSPGWTSYDKRVFYNVFDVTEHLTQDNVIGMMLGNGWYNPLPLKMWGSRNLRDHLTIGTPSALLQLVVTYTDGSSEQIVSDETWKAIEGPVRKNSVYLGDSVDYRYSQPGWKQPGFNDADWANVTLQKGPSGILQVQPIPPIRLTERLRPVLVREQRPGVYLFDLGQNITGYAELKCEGKAGTEIRVRYGELLYPDGSLNGMTAVCGQIKNKKVPEGSEEPATAWQEDVYYLRGEGTEILHPHFTFHGFRYVEVSGFPGVPSRNSLVGCRLHTDLQPVGTFSCSNDLFNRIQEISVQTLRNNLHSVQSDCPHREKFGYGGDLLADGILGLYNFDMANFYAKVTHDYADAVRPNGGFTETAPYVGIADKGLGEGSGPIGWGTMHPYMLWELYQWYGDIALVAEQYEAAKRWVVLLEENADDFLLDMGIGDHETLAPKDTAVSATAFFYYNVRLMLHLAGILDRKEDVAYFSTLADRIAHAFNSAFYHPETGTYGNGSQASQAFALHMQLVPEGEKEAVTKALLQDIHKKHAGHLSTGIFGTPYMLFSLSKHDEVDSAFEIVNQRNFPGWGHMLENGATTLWEHWEYSDNTYSHNHPMFGSVSGWFYGWLAGIRPTDTTCAWDTFLIAPTVPEKLDWAHARLEIVRGRVEVNWRKDEDGFHLLASVPVNSTATVCLPATKDSVITEHNSPITELAAISSIRRDKKTTSFQIGSGTYAFRVTE